MIRHILARLWIPLSIAVAAAIATACGQDCRLLCSGSGEGLTCGEGFLRCQNTFDRFGRRTGTNCSYANGPSFSCSYQHNDLGQVTAGSCRGEGDTCQVVPDSRN